MVFFLWYALWRVCDIGNFHTFHVQAWFLVMSTVYVWNEFHLMVCFMAKFYSTPGVMTFDAGILGFYP